MRVLLFLIFCMPAALLAQAPAAGSNWQHVQQLPIHTRVYVAANQHSRVCAVDSVTAEELVCSHGDKPGYRFQRSEIKSIKLSRRAVSTLAGAGIGAGAGAAIGFAAIHPKSGGILDFSGDARAICAGIGLVAGAAVGWPTDFLRGPTVYVRP